MKLIIYLCGMYRMVSHIERLLLVHDCVIVPGLGGFVLQSVPAVCNRAEHFFCPSGKEIGFNRTLQHSDGLLAEAYMRQYAVNFRKAQAMIEEDVEEIKRALSLYHKVPMGMLGILETDGEDRLIFNSAHATFLDTRMYGLPNFHFTPLPPQQPSDIQVQKNRTKTERKDVFYIPISYRLLRGVVASAAAVTLFLLLSTPVKDVDRRAYQASFIPTEIVSERYASAFQKKEEVQEATRQPVETETEEVLTPIHTQTVTEETETTVEPAITLPAQETAPPASNRKTYHIVIASFPTETQAETYISGVDKTVCTRVGMVHQNDKFRVYAAQFENRQDAQEYLTELRTHPKYKDAWICISR